jgi:hypothetical protein
MTVLPRGRLCRDYIACYWYTMGRWVTNQRESVYPHRVESLIVYDLAGDWNLYLRDVPACIYGWV